MPRKVTFLNMALACYEKKEETIKAELTTLSPLNKVEMMVEELEGGGGWPEFFYPYGNDFVK